jgi:Flp pilus assembly protein TadB
MVAHASEGPILLAKKIGGLFLIIFGCLLTAAGVNLASAGLTVVGAVLLIAGAILLVLKILRRNAGRRVG